MPDHSGAGRPRKSFTDKGRSGQHNEAVDIKTKSKESGHQFQALLVASGLMAKDEGFSDLAFVCRRLAEDPHLATKVKEAITSPPREGTKLPTTTKLYYVQCSAHFLCLFTNFVYKF